MGLLNTSEHRMVTYFIALNVDKIKGLIVEVIECLIAVQSTIDS